MTYFLQSPLLLATLPTTLFLLFRSRRDDIEDEDDQESFFRVMKDVPLEYYPDDDEEIDYDSDGNPIAPPRSKVYMHNVK